MYQYGSYNQFNQPYMQGYTQPTGDKIWVQGEDAARAYLVAPNGSVTLWDSQKHVFYEKKADSSGRPYLESYEYTKRNAEMPEEADFKQDVKNELLEQINALEGRIIALEKGGKRNAKQSNADDSTI